MCNYINYFGHAENWLDVGLASAGDVASRRRSNVGPTSSLDVGLASSGDVASRRQKNVGPTSSPDGGLASFGDVASLRRNQRWANIVGPTSSPDVGLASSGDVASRHRNNVGPTSTTDSDVAAPMPTFADVGSM